MNNMNLDLILYNSLYSPILCAISIILIFVTLLNFNKCNMQDSHKFAFSLMLIFIALGNALYVVTSSFFVIYGIFEIVILILFSKTILTNKECNNETNSS